MIKKKKPGLGTSKILSSAEIDILEKPFEQELEKKQAPSNYIDLKFIQVLQELFFGLTRMSVKIKDPSDACSHEAHLSPLQRSWKRFEKYISRLTNGKKAGRLREVLEW